MCSLFLPNLVHCNIIIPMFIQKNMNYISEQRMSIYIVNSGRTIAHILLYYSHMPKCIISFGNKIYRPLLIINITLLNSN